TCVLRDHRVADPAEHVGDWIGHSSRTFLFWGSSFKVLDLKTEPRTPNRALPAALRHACDVALKRQLPKTEAAERELPQVPARSATQAAPVTQTDLELGRLHFLRDLCCGCHMNSSLFRCSRVFARESAQFCRNGIPMNCKSLRASSSLFAVVTTDTFIPRALS